MHSNLPSSLLVAQYELKKKNNYSDR